MHSSFFTLERFFFNLKYVLPQYHFIDSTNLNALIILNVKDKTNTGKIN